MDYFKCEVIMNNSVKRTLSIVLGFLTVVAPLSVRASEPAQEAAKEVVQSVWQSVQENARGTLVNLWDAGCNVFSFVPYVLKQVTAETKTLSNALKDCPLASTAVVCGAAFGLYKTYKWFQESNVSNVLRERVMQIQERVHQRDIQQRNQNF